jgi:DNA-binding response OmpR family regulator
VELESKPRDVLLHLLEHPAEVVKKEHLLEAVWEITHAKKICIYVRQVGLVSDPFPHISSRD